MTTTVSKSLSPRYYLWRLLCYKPWLWLLTILAYMILYGLNFAPPLIARAIFDNLTGEAGNNTLGTAGLAGFSLWTLVVLLFGSAVGRQAAYVALIAGQTWYTYLVGTLVRVNLFEQILQRPAAQALPSSAGEALSRFRDDIQTTSTFLSSLFNLIGLSVFVLLAIVTMVRISPLLTVIAFLPLVIINIIIHQSSNRIIRFRTANQIATGQVTGLLGEIFGAVQAIKLADAEASVIAHFNQINDNRRQVALKDRLISEVLSALGGNLGDIGAAIILLVMGQALRTGDFTVGDFALFTYVMPFAASNVRSVVGVLTNYRQLGVSLQRLTALLGEQPATTVVAHRPVYLREPLPSLPATVHTAENQMEMLTVAGLTFQYPESTHGIFDISFQLPRGSFTVITGRIGAGKSTLLRALLGLLPKTAGEIYWNETLVADAGRFFQPPHTAYTPQNPRLFSDSLRENILMGVALSPATLSPLGLATKHARQVNTKETFPSASLTEAIHNAVLEQDVAQLADGLETVVGPRGVRLSGGQIQRTAAARMFVRQPELLVFDDLSSALDVETEAELWGRLRSQQRAVAREKQSEQSYLVVSNRRVALENADQIIVLQDGFVTDVGTLETLLANNQEVQNLWYRRES